MKTTYLRHTTFEFWKLLLINSFLFFISRSRSLLFRAHTHSYAANFASYDKSELNIGKSAHANSKFYSEGFLRLKIFGLSEGCLFYWISKFSLVKRKIQTLSTPQTPLTFQKYWWVRFGQALVLKWNADLDTLAGSPKAILWSWEWTCEWLLNSTSREWERKRTEIHWWLLRPRCWKVLYLSNQISLI